MSISSIFFLVWAFFSLSRTIYEKLIVKPLHFVAKKLKKWTDQLLKRMTLGFLALLDTIPSQTRGILLMGLSIILSLCFIGYALLPFFKELWSQLSQLSTVSFNQTLIDSTLWIQSVCIYIYSQIPRMSLLKWKKSIKLNEKDILNSLGTSQDIQKRLNALENSLKSFVSLYTQSQEKLESDVSKKWQETLNPLKLKLENSISAISQVEKSVEMESKQVTDLKKTILNIQESLKTMSSKKQVESLVGSLDLLYKKVDSLSTQVDSFKNTLKPKEFEKLVVQVLDKVIPDKLAARIDKGKVILTPEFWKLLKSSFASLKNSKESSSSISEQELKSYFESQLSLVLTKQEWKQIYDDFMKRNSALVLEISKNTLKQHIDSRILVTKEHVLEMIKDQISSLSSKDSLVYKNIAELFSDRIQRALSDLESQKQSNNLKPDYALSTAGGKILFNLTSETYSVPYKSWLLKTASSFLGVKRINPKGPRTAIETSIHPGDCWAMKGILQCFYEF